MEDLFHMTVLRDKNCQLLRKSKNGHRYYIVKMTLAALKDPDYKYDSTVYGKKVKQKDEITVFIFEDMRELQFVEITQSLVHKAFTLDEKSNVVMNGMYSGLIERESTRPYKYKGNLCNFVRFFVFTGEDRNVIRRSTEIYFVNKKSR